VKKLVFVTGAGRGIGRAIALRLVSEGYRVCGCARSVDQLKETQRAVGGRGEFRVSQVDVSKPEAVREWIEGELHEAGAVASAGASSHASVVPWGLVTAAGVYGPIGSFLENSWEQWRESVEINLYGTALAVKFFSQQLIVRGLGGRIVLLSGGGATKPLPNFSSYCASKAAVVRWGETMALELQAHHIFVNSVAPGAVNTKLTDDLIAAGPALAGQDMYERALKQKANTEATPDRASDLTAFLLSDRADGITGKLLAAMWDPWEEMEKNSPELRDPDVYTLRRTTPPAGAGAGGGVGS
jgi:NAD(P)-dependent dehydrogenase (short-subunit alcohol dehydrogenase family)